MKKMLSFVLLAVSALSPASLQADDPTDQDKARAAIQKMGEDYVVAYNRRDAKAIAEFWSPDAVYTNRTTGEEVVGRDAIQKVFTTLFAEKEESKAAITSDSIQFVSPNVAVEHGTARFVTGEEATSTEYSAVYVRRDGKWLLDRVTDIDKPGNASHYDHLKDLEWMIGSWVDAEGGSQIVTNCSWTRNKNFMLRSFTVSVDDRVDLTGMQLVGWDASTKQIRSWVFDSDGGFAKGTWKRKNDRWYISKSGVLPDGGRTSAVNIIQYVDENSFDWQSVSRSVDGQILPSIATVRVIRADSDE